MLHISIQSVSGKFQSDSTITLQDFTQIAMCLKSTSHIKNPCGLIKINAD